MCLATWPSRGAMHIFPSGSAWAGYAPRPRRSGGGDGCRAERDEVERQEDELQAQLDREAEEDAAHSDFTSNVRHRDTIIFEKQILLHRALSSLFVASAYIYTYACKNIHAGNNLHLNENGWALDRSN